MKKTVKIDLTGDRLISIAADMVDKHNYIDALKMLNKNAELHLNDADSYTLYAEIYDDLGLYEKCVNSWFKFLDCADYADFSEAYEGLAIAYLNLGNESFSAMYYNKILTDTQQLDEEARAEILNSFLRRERNPLKFVYPPEIADYSDEIANGIEAMKAGDYDKAAEYFDEVAEKNESYLTARNYIAMCKIINDKCEEAEAECLSILEKYPDNIQALTTLAAVKTEQKKGEESRALAEKLIALNSTSTDDIYKIATVCCENKMHEQAFVLFSKLEKELPYDSSVLYFKAVSAFNSGHYEESLDAFDRMVTIYPDAVTALYWYRTAREAIDGGEKKELSYFYRMPAEQRNESLKILAVVSRMPKKESRQFLNIVDVSDCIRWSFDEIDPRGDSEMHYVAAACAVKAGLDGLVCDLLLNAFLSDSLKVHILNLIGRRNEVNNFGVVVSHIYKTIDFHALCLGRLKRKSFVAAYARLVSHFSLIDNDYGEKFAAATETLYQKLAEREKLYLSADGDALAAAIFRLSGVEHLKESKELCEFFGTREEKIKAILGDL